MRVSLVIVVFTLCSGPASAQLGFNATKESKMGAVNKVVAMLEALKSKIQFEGDSEAATYNTFACFCKDTMTTKKTLVDQGTTAVGTLKDTIEAKSTARDGLDSDIEDIEKEISDKEAEMAVKKFEAKQALKLYTTNEADMAMAVKSLEDAIAFMKASETKAAAITLVQRKTIADTVQSAAAMADALGWKVSPAAAALLQEDPTWEYSGFHGTDIITTLEGLETTFKEEKTKLDEAEVARVNAYDQYRGEAKEFLETKNSDLDTKKSERATTIDELETASKDISVTSATLLDDQSYLMELSKICKDKKITYDKRASVRADELGALTAAIKTINEAVATQVSKATVRLTQRSATLYLSAERARSPSVMEAIEADAEAHEGRHPPTFLQKTRSDSKAARPHFLDAIMNGLDKEISQKNSEPAARASPESATPADTESQFKSAARQAIMSLLRTKGDRLKSTMLTALAAQVGADPLAKVKDMIQVLIEKLQREASSEEDMKGWCDQKFSDATLKKQNAATEIAEINARMSKLEVRRDSLTEEIEKLTAEHLKLNTSLTEANSIRLAESVQAAATIAEAKEGLNATTMAITILDRYYKTAAKAKVVIPEPNTTLVQTKNATYSASPVDDMPDAGFEIGEAYTGAQGSAKGVIGMLEVIKGDFVRTVKETTKSEAKAKKEHYEFTVESETSMAEKEMAKTQNTKLKEAALADLSDDDSKLDSEVASLETAIKELMAHKTTCIDTGMSYEERVANREEEIAALRTALCIFENFRDYSACGA